MMNKETGEEFMKTDEEFMNLEWKTEYNTGIEKVDLQHHYFYDLIRTFINEFSETDDKKYKELLTRELTFYTRFHFLSEENIVYRMGFSGLKEHKEIHRDLVEKLNVHLNKLTLSPFEKSELISFLKSWFLNHTLIEDKKILASR